MSAEDNSGLIDTSICTSILKKRRNPTVVIDDFSEQYSDIKLKEIGLKK